MTGFHKLTIDQLENFIEKNKKYEYLLPEMLEDARFTLLHKKIAEFIEKENDAKKGFTSGN
jgi:SPX domain protein involved in polyphosphate accumulation